MGSIYQAIEKHGIRLTYPRDYRQEKQYGFSSIGIIVTLILIGVIMTIVVILLGNSIFVIFPFVDPSIFQTNPEISAAVPYFALILVVSFAGLIGSWFYSRFRHLDLESEDINSR
jgi:ABC-type multidrug transport system fused ATPase/permease subunit